MSKILKYYLKIEENLNRIQEEIIICQNFLTIREYIKSSFDITAQIKRKEKFLELKKKSKIKFDEKYFNGYDSLLEKKRVILENIF